MTNHKEWNEFLNHMLSNALTDYKETKEYEYSEKQRHQADNLLVNILTADQKKTVEECIYEMGLASQREGELLYQQGIRDCVFILKQLGVFA